MLAVGRVQPGEVPVPVQAEPARRGRRRPRSSSSDGRPAQRRGRVPSGGQGVAGVVLAVAEGPLAVLPRLAPGDRGQADEERPRGQQPGEPIRRGAIGRAAPLQAVVAADVVIDARPPGPAARAGRRSPRSGAGCRWMGCTAAPSAGRRTASRRTGRGPARTGGPRRRGRAVRGDGAGHVEVGVRASRVSASNGRSTPGRRRRSGRGRAGWPSPAGPARAGRWSRCLVRS